MKKNNKKILVIDDDRGIGGMLTMLLERNGYEVILSGKPEETEKIIIAHDIEVVLLDLLILDVNGIDVCARLRRNENTHHVTIIMMSALEDAGEECRAAGADEFIAKPFNIDDILGKIAKVFKREVKPI